MVAVGRLSVSAMGALTAVLLVGCNPPAVVDALGSDLSVRVTVIDTEANPSDGKVPIVLQFSSNGTVVQLAAGASVTCNGVAMPWNGLGYAERVPIVAAGGTYTCVHERNGVTSSILITVPARPVILSPTPGAFVARSASLTVTYVADAGTGVRVSAGDGSTGLGGNLQPDNGASTVDVSSLKAGPGSIGVTREFAITPAPGGFQAASVSYSSGSDISVTWT